MGRELKRVPLSFDWPLNKPWKGYINPHHVATDCPACEGSGSSPEARRLKDLWYGYVPFRPEDRGSVPFTAGDDGPVFAWSKRQCEQAPEYYGTSYASIQRNAQRLCKLLNAAWSHHLNDDDVTALIEAGRLMDFTHTWTKETGWKPKLLARNPTAAQVNLWSIQGIGHDSINCWVVINAECKRRGWATKCAACDGEGAIWPCEEAKQIYEAWEREEPPTGEAYQIWETVSEGSPISPPFSTPEDLARYMATTRWGADTQGTPYETWLKFIKGPGWALSMVVDNQGVHDGVSAGVAEMED